LTIDSRDILIGRISDGNDTTHTGDNSKKSILARGCDTEMGRRAIELLPPILGNPEMVSVTNDDYFITELQRKKWSVIHFAPGACRYDVTKSPIPGSSSLTEGWGLAEYRNLVRKYQGEDIKIVETTDERQIIPLLRKALESINEI
jgi:predicted nuclease with RNAse H fold